MMLRGRTHWPRGSWTGSVSHHGAEGAAMTFLIKAKLDPSPGDSPRLGEDSPLGVPARATEASPTSEVWLEPTCGNADETTCPQGFQGPSQSGCKATAPLPQWFQAPCRQSPSQAGPFTRLWAHSALHAGSAVISTAFSLYGNTTKA